MKNLLNDPHGKVDSTEEKTNKTGDRKQKCSLVNIERKNSYKKMNSFDGL